MPQEDEASNVLKRLLRLVQIASNPGLVSSNYNNEPGKFQYLKDLVFKICSQGQKCIVWSCFNDNVDWLAKQLREFGCRRIHGKINMDARNRSVEKFMTDAKVRVLIATPGSAKEGLTLTVANHVIFYDRGFSLDDYLQAQDRIHRISQKNTCYIYNLCMRESVDEWVDVLLESKRVAASLAQGDITLDEYRKSMTYDFSEILRQVLESESINKV
jgi:SNF2 family DNA or RNA helicase